MEKVLVQKYGRKAFDAMEDFRPYIGMPEGIVREYKLVMKDVNFIAYGFVRVESGYKVYLPTRLFAMTASYINARIPRAIYTKTGKWLLLSGNYKLEVHYCPDKIRIM